MYRVSVPLINRTVTAATREEYLCMFRRGEVERVFLVPSTDMEKGCVYDFEALCENLRFFSAHGIEPAIWVGTTLGHGGLLHDVAKQHRDQAITPIVNLAGKAIGDTRCPLDPLFRENMARVFRKLARSGAKTILIDDDFRLSQRTDEFCCFCKLHLARVAQNYGAEVTRDDLRAHIMHGKPNPMRDAFLQAQGDSLRELARVLREAVDEVDPTVNLALCCCHSIWDSDGIDPIELTEILRGENKALLRLHGAPYWAAHSSKRMPAVFELARMFAAFCRDTDYELINEGDAYPRPRYHTPASYVELHDALMRADASTHGILKYMCDYVSPPDYEMGYLEYHCRDLPVLRGIEEVFEGREQLGVRVEIRSQPLKESDCALTSVHIQSPYPTAGSLLGHNGIPTTYRDRGICRAAFGETVNGLDDAALGGGLILDAVSAILLTERGIDVGLPDGVSLRDAFVNTEVPYLLSSDRFVRTLTKDREARILCVTPCNGAGIMLLGETPEGECPLCYRYENADGQRFLVFLYEGLSLNHHSGLLRGYLVQSVLTSGIEWVARKPLPASCMGHPDLYLICAGDGTSLTVGLFNCYADPVFAPKVKLNGEYRKLSGLNTSGTVEGNTVTLADIPPFSFAMFTVRK